jgi:hypothetical protein
MTTSGCTLCENDPRACGCCAGVRISTPASLVNAPALTALAYRVGTHGQFFESMKARLSSVRIELEDGSSLLPLERFTKRDLGDPSIALLDAWATIGDVLSFYQERIANEGYLRTATERRSVLELARLVGYAPRPGVAATAYLAFTIDPKTEGDVKIPVGTRAQSVPNPGEEAQKFETGEELTARAEWNELHARANAPRVWHRMSAMRTDSIYLAGTTTGLKSGDPLLFVFGSAPLERLIRVVDRIEVDDAAKRTRVWLRPFGELLAALAPLLFEIVEIFGELAAAAADDDDDLTSVRYRATHDFLTVYLDDALLGNHLLFAQLLSGIVLGLPLSLNKLAISHDVIYREILAKKKAAPGRAEPLPESVSTFGQPAGGRIAEILSERRRGVGPTLIETLAGRVNITVFPQPAGGTAPPAGEQPPPPAPPPPPPAEPPPGPVPDDDPLDTDLRVKLLGSLARLAADAFAMSFLADLVAHAVREALPRNERERRAFQRYVAGELQEILKGKDRAEYLPAIRAALRRHLAEAFKVPATRPEVVDALDAFLAVLDVPLVQRRLRALLEKLEPLPRDKKLEQLAAVVGLLEKRLDKKKAEKSAKKPFGSLVTTLKAAPTPQLRSGLELKRDPHSAFSGKSDNVVKLLFGFQPTLKENLYASWSKTAVERGEPELRAVYALRLNAPPFGHNAPKQVIVTEKERQQDVERKEWKVAKDENADNVFLDNDYPSIAPGSYALIDAKPDMNAVTVALAIARLKRQRDATDPITTYELLVLLAQLARRFHLLKALQADVESRSEYDMNGKAKRLELDGAWRLTEIETLGDETKRLRNEIWSLRHTLVWTQSERLELAEEPIEDPICQASSIELDRLVDGLDSGRWLVVSGERTDVGVSGVQASELVMLAAVTHDRDPKLPRDTTHTTLGLVKPLTYCYRRDTLKIFANVAKATQGETRKETLGAGDGTKPNQEFKLKQPPLTYTAAPTASGAKSTLHVFVNEVEWHEAPMLPGTGPTDRIFVAKTEDDGKTTLVFGNGYQGARLPTGLENVRAEYRSGIGAGGNVKAGQISVLVTRPLGLREVANPLPSSGGADRETRDQARKNAPLVVRALDRLVSVPDYADFARTFAGIGKASAVELSNGSIDVVHLTIAGVGDIPIDPSSDLFRNLREALFSLGDPLQEVRVATREALTLIVSARVRPLPDYPWQDLEARVRARLLDAFGFERRELGQSVTSSEVLGVIQGVRGVEYVDLDVLDAVSESELVAFFESQEQASEEDREAEGLLDFLAARDKSAGSRTPGAALHGRVNARQARPDERRADDIAPAELAYLSSAVPDSLVLNPIEDQ